MGFGCFKTINLKIGNFLYRVKINLNVIYAMLRRTLNCLATWI